MATTERKKIEYSNIELAGGNFAIVAWILLGTMACWLVISFGALIFMGLAGFLVFYELGKKGCGNCFLCKTCTIGMGKLPSLFFTKTAVQDLNTNRKALRLFPWVYAFLTVVPIVVLATLLFIQFSVTSLGLLLGLGAFSVLTGALRWKIIVHR
jgi:hypothetical protein